VGPNGELYIAWHSVATGELLYDRDLDGLFSGLNSFGIDTTAVSLFSNVYFKKVPAAPDRGIFTGSSLDVDRSGGTNNGSLYLAYVNNCDVCSGDNYDVFLARSADQGVTWVNTGRDPGNVENSSGTDFHAWVDVDQKTGSVSVVYYTTDGDQTSGNDDIRVRLATSTDGGLSFTKSILSTSTSNETGGSSSDYLEYNGLAVHDGTAHAVWGGKPGPETDLEAMTASASLSSATNGNALVVSGDDSGATNDTIVVRPSAANGEFLEVVVNGQRQFAGLLASIDKITASGLGGVDSISIDSTFVAFGILIDGGASDDLISGGSGPDTLLGGPGNDRLEGGDGSDSLVGGTGDDVFVFDDVLATASETDWVNEIASEGNDTLDFSRLAFTAPVTVDCGKSNGLALHLKRTINGSAKNIIETVIGGAGNDTILGSNQNAIGNRLEGRDGNDTITGLKGPDTIDGGNGNDSLTGSRGNDFMLGGNGNDKLFGLQNDDRLDGGDGDDSLDGGVANDRIIAGLGSDTLIGGKGNDVLDVGNTLDSLVDQLTGGQGIDRAIGKKETLDQLLDVFEIDDRTL